MKQIQKLTISNPRIVNITFLLFVIIAMTPFFVFIASAKTITFYWCDTIFSESPFVTIDREYTKLCNNRFQFLSNKLKRQFINQYNNNKYDLQK